MPLILRFLFRRRAIDMQPLRGNVLSTVYCRTGLWQRLSKLIIFFSSFPWDFCLFCVFIPLFSRLSAWHVSNICWDQINLIHFVNGFFFYHRFLDQWCSLVQPLCLQGFWLSETFGSLEPCLGSRLEEDVNEKRFPKQTRLDCCMNISVKKICKPQVNRRKNHRIERGQLITVIKRCLWEPNVKMNQSDEFGKYEREGVQSS